MIGDYSRQTISLESSSGVDDYGDRTYSAASNISGRYEARATLVLNSAGQQVVSNGRIFTSSTIAVDDRITYAGKTYHVVSVESAEGLDGPSHSIAYLGG
jgi:hypothetical protein